MKTNEILTVEQIKDLQELGVTISPEAHVSLSEVIGLILSKGCSIKLELCDEGFFAESGYGWCISESVTGVVHALLCLLIKGDKINPEEVIF
ncbi:hypothetical protein EZS27_027072 [termite gut metagenome]|uniref:Uncharacterized protein n=1 Tax=termite gut metagenome TaxID=433724 RepID=A0A5J4QR57_9ZZZZ